MLPAPEPLPLLTGLDEAALYHHAGDRGFFTLLWADPEQANRAAQVALERQQLKLELAALASPLPSTVLLEPPGKNGCRDQGATGTAATAHAQDSARLSSG